MRGALQFEPLMRFVQDDPEYALRVLASKHSPMQRRSIAAMREQLSQEVEAGNLRPPLPLDDLAYVIVRIVESYLYSDVIAGRDPDIAGGVAAIHALLLAPPVPARDCSAQRDRALAA
jgi:hypothetical protein